MRNDGRLSRMLHILVHMARHDGPMTSDTLAGMLRTNPVLIRRTMSGLRDAGYVRSEKGHGGGWAIAADLDAVTLLDVHRAVGGPRFFAVGIERPEPGCQIADIVNEAVGDALNEAEQLLIRRLGSITLATLVQTFDARCGGGVNQAAGMS
jgi:DNA-binding IscR family transcriptional regulator